MSGKRDTFRARPRLWAALLIVAATFVAYARVLGQGFIDYDDGIYVTQNAYVRSGLSGAGVVWAFATSHAANWHPLTWLSHMLDCQVFGLEPSGHHLTSLALHIANAVLLLLALEALTGRVWPSAFVAGLFALHPLRVESVAWIAERKDVLSGTFWMLALLAWTAYARRGGGARYLVALALFALGLLAKPMVVTLPFVLLLLDVWPLRRLALGAGTGRTVDGASREGTPHRPPADHARAAPVPSDERRPEAVSPPATRGRTAEWAGTRQVLSGRPASPGFLVLEKIPFLALSALSCIVTVWAQRSAGALASAEEVPVGLRLANALVAPSSYIVKTLWPWRLAVFYPLPAAPPVAAAFASALLLGGVTSLAVWQARRRPVLLVGWLWYLGALVPVLGLVQVGLQSTADRYTYLPSIGLFLAATWAASELAPAWRHGRAALAAAATLALGASFVLTVRQTGFWRSSEALFAQALALAPDSAIVHYHLANVLQGQGRIEEAVAHYEESLRIAPDGAAAHNNLGMVLARQEKGTLAAQHYEQALRIKPDYAEAHNNLGSLMARQGRRAEAIAQYVEALRIRPAYAEAHNNLGVALGNEGRSAEAVTHFREALRLAPDLVEARLNLGYALALGGKLDEATREFERALWLEPGSAQGHYYLGLARAGQKRSREAIGELRAALGAKPDWPEALTALARILAADPDEAPRSGEEAIALAERACELTGHQQLGVLETLAFAYARSGRWSDAIETTVRAAEIARSSGQSDRAVELERRLEEYRSHLPGNARTRSSS